MNISCTIVCILVARFPCSEQVLDRPNASLPATGLVVTIDPDQLFGQGLSQSWINVNAPFGNNRVASQPLSKVNFELLPIESSNGAVVEIQLTGTTVGASTSSNQSSKIAMDSLTQCEARQRVYINSSGLTFDDCIYKVQSNQSLNHVKSKNPFTGAMVKMAFRHFPEQVSSRADSFARQQIQNHLAISNADLKHAIESATRQMIAEYPLIGEFDWHFSTDRNRIYLTAMTNAPISDSPTIRPAAISIALHESIAEQALNRGLANLQLDSTHLEAFYASVSKNFKLPPLGDRSDSAWSITLSQKPVEIEFIDDSMVIRLTSEHIESDGRTLSGLTVVVGYSLKLDRGSWLMVRNDAVDVIDPANGNGTLGARQQVFRTVMRKRFDRIIPRSITIPELNRSKRSEQLDVDLQFQRFILKDRNLVIAIDNR